MEDLSHPGHGDFKCCIVGNWTETLPVANVTANWAKGGSGLPAVNLRNSGCLYGAA